MAIKIHDLRYIRRSPGEIAVLRELVSFQQCKIINPSEFWLSQMTRHEREICAPGYREVGEVWAHFLRSSASRTSAAPIVPPTPTRFIPRASKNSLTQAGKS